MGSGTFDSRVGSGFGVPGEWALTGERDGDEGKRPSLVCELPIATQGHVSCSSDGRFPSLGGRAENHFVAWKTSMCEVGGNRTSNDETFCERGVSFRILEVLSEGRASGPDDRGQA